MSGIDNIRTYLRSECAVFRKTGETFGGLSNMAPGFPVRINGARIPTVEALYQACRFPHLVDVQRKIIGQHSPMTAKMVSKPYRENSRSDWNRVRVKIMRWCLRLKLAMNFPKFSQLLLSTGERSIVEDSRKDAFWGAIPSDSTTLVGMNVLGRLLMELREEIKIGTELRYVEPPSIPDFFLFSEPLAVVDFRTDKSVPMVESKPSTTNSIDELSLPLFAEIITPMPLPKKRQNSHLQALASSPGMIEGLRPYENYKDSGQRWIGQVPHGWRILPLCRVCTLKSECGRPDLELLSVYLNRGVIRHAESGGQVHKPSLDLGRYQVVEPGDFVLNNQQAWRGSIGVSLHLGIISPAYLIMRLDGSLNPDYANLLFRSPAMVAQYVIASRGVGDIQRNLYYPELRGSLVPVPTPDEQAAIVRFLDHANRKIDWFIRAKRKLIGLLNEQKQAIIHRAVTRSLDPNAKLKLTGIPWLGEIPEHWEVRRAKYLFREMDDRSKEGKEVHLAMSQRLGLVPSSMVDSAMRSESYAGGKLCQEGDLVLNRLKAHLGVFALAKQAGVISPDYSVFRMRTRINMAYYESVLRSSACRRELRVRAKGLVEGFWRLYTDDFYDIRLPVPPFDEQVQIMKAISEETESLATAIARTEREIALMQEYRTRLTADIVTGKLDVREAAAKLPDELSETLIEPEDSADFEATVSEE